MGVECSTRSWSQILQRRDRGLRLSRSFSPFHAIALAISPSRPREITSDLFICHRLGPCYASGKRDTGRTAEPMASRCEKERDPIPIFPRGASFHSSFLSRLRHPGHKLTKWPAILDPGRRRATKNNARFLCDLESTRLSLSPRSAGFGAARAFLLFTPSWKKGRFAWKLGSSRAGTTATRRRCRSIRQGWRKKGGGAGRAGQAGGGGGKGHAGSGQATRDPFKSPSDFSFRTPHCRRCRRRRRRRRRCRRPSRITVLCHVEGCDRGRRDSSHD